MRITNLEPQTNNPERFNLYVDGHFLLGVNAAIVLQMGLHVEQELSPEQLEQLRGDEAEQQAVDRALNYLSSTAPSSTNSSMTNRTSSSPCVLAAKKPCHS